MTISFRYTCQRGTWTCPKAQKNTWNPENSNYGNVANSQKDDHVMRATLGTSLDITTILSAFSAWSGPLTRHWKVIGLIQWMWAVLKGLGNRSSPTVVGLSRLTITDGIFFRCVPCVSRGFYFRHWLFQWRKENVKHLKTSEGYRFMENEACRTLKGFEPSSFPMLRHSTWNFWNFDFMNILLEKLNTQNEQASFENFNFTDGSNFQRTSTA